MSTDLDDPFLRAIFAYLASGEWSDVLDEEALPLRDRVGVALRFLPDDEVKFFSLASAAEQERGSYG